MSGAPTNFVLLLELGRYFTTSSWTVEVTVEEPDVAVRVIV